MVGEAANLLSHMSIMKSAYDLAWERLNERYDRPRHIVICVTDLLKFLDDRCEDFYLFTYSPTVGTLTGYMTITKLSTKGLKVIVNSFLN